MPPETLANSQAVELGELLSNTIGAVVKAQEQLDAYSLRRKQTYEESKEGELALPPLWYVFNQVSLEIELSTSVQSLTTPGEKPATRITCQTLNPMMVALYGHTASSGMRVAVNMAPSGFIPIKTEESSQTR
jgi:hypothetical protein